MMNRETGSYGIADRPEYKELSVPGDHCLTGLIRPSKPATIAGNLPGLPAFRMQILQMGSDSLQFADRINTRVHRNGRQQFMDGRLPVSIKPEHSIIMPE